MAFAIHPIAADAENSAAILSVLSTAFDAVAFNDQQIQSATSLLQPSVLADWEDKQNSPPNLQQHASFWAASLHGATCTLDLPRSVTRSKAVAGAVWTIPVQLPTSVWQKANQVAANEATTPVAVLLAAFQVSS